MLGLQEDHLHDLAAWRCDVQLLEGQCVPVQHRVQVLPSVAGLRILLVLSWLEKKQTEPWDYWVEIPLLHCCNLRVLVPKCHKIPESCHFNQLRIEFLADFAK